MKSYICTKCNKKFNTAHNLSQHLTRKVSCDTVLKCEICDKEFTEERRLTNHLNRKTPCSKKSTASHNINHIQELEILDKKLEIEKEKTKRKNIRINIQNNIQNSFQINIPPPQIQTHNSTMENTIEYFNKYIKTMSLSSFDMMIAQCNTIKDVIVSVMKLFYNNPNYPEYRNIIYIADTDKFYSLKDMEWCETKFEDLYPLLSKSLNKTFMEFGAKGYDPECIATHYPAMVSYKVKTAKTPHSTRKKEIKDCAEQALEAEFDE